MNDYLKGNRLQNEFKKVLLSKGFIVDAKVRPRFPRKPRDNDYSLSVDIFGRFDIMAKHPAFPDNWYLFQIATIWKYAEKLKEIEDFNYGNYDYPFIVRRKNRKPFEIKLYSKLHKFWQQVDFDEYPKNER